MTSLRRSLVIVVIAGYAVGSFAGILVLTVMLNRANTALHHEAAEEFLEMGIDSVDQSAYHFFQSLIAVMEARPSLDPAVVRTLVKPGEIVVVTDRRGSIRFGEALDDRVRSVVNPDQIRTAWERYAINGRRDVVMDNFAAARADRGGVVPTRIVFRLFRSTTRRSGTGVRFTVLLRGRRFCRLAVINSWPCTRSWGRASSRSSEWSSGGRPIEP